MKIVFLSVFYPFRGGISQFSTALVKKLKLRNKVLLINFKRQYPGFLFPGKTQFVEKGDPVEKLDSLRILDSINPFSYIRTVRLINQSQSDILLVNYWMTFFGISKGFIAKRAKTRLKVAILHNLVPHERKFYDTIVNRYFVRQFDGFVVMSEQVKDDLLHLKPDAKWIKLQHPTYNHFGEKLEREKACKELGISSTSKNILFFGLIRNYKGLDILLQAFALLDENYHLLIAGESYEDFSKYEEIIRSEQLDNRILKEIRYIKDQEVATFFSASDLCVLPYKTATQSGIIAVANQFEIPVVATKVGGLNESVKHQVDGELIEPNNAKALHQAMISIFEGDKITKYKEQIRLKKKTLDWDSFARQTEEFIQKL